MFRGQGRVRAGVCAVQRLLRGGDADRADLGRVRAWEGGVGGNESHVGLVGRGDERAGCDLYGGVVDGTAEGGWGGGGRGCWRGGGSGGGGEGWEGGGGEVKEGR